MRGKVLRLTTLILAFLIGGITMYYIDNNSKPITILKSEDNNQNNGVIKCNNNVKIDETGIATSVGKIYDATVTIQNYVAGKLTSSGSGFVYKKDDKYGYILTNHHVIEGATKLVITMSDDRQVEGKVLGSDKYLDIAVVAIDVSYVSQVATLGTSENAYVGDTIITVGSPVGYEYRGTVTRGTLSGKNRMVEVSVVTVNDFVMNVLQIDAAINPGNSGGPLVDINGNVIGINSLKLVEDQIEGMGFAIPIEFAMKYIGTLEEGKAIERPFIGITMLNANDTYKLYQKGIMLDDSIKNGVVVVEVSGGSGAAKAGLKKGDVIISINGNDVSDAAHLKYLLFQHSPNDEIVLDYIRGDKTNKTTLKLTKLEN